MKFTSLILSVFLFQYSPPTLLLLDTNYQTVPTTIEDFTWDLYMSKRFPIYAEDKKAIINSAKNLAKFIDNNPPCNYWDTATVKHSRFIVFAKCDGYKTYTINLQTTITEKKLVCTIQLANKETDPKKVQRKLIDFASYLEGDN